VPILGIIASYLLKMCRLMFLPNGTVQKGPAHQLPQELDDPNTRYLVDSIEPEDHNAKILVVASPFFGHTNNFRKRFSTATWYMPIWTYDEIAACQQVGHP
jgi:hypothetical protein